MMPLSSEALQAVPDWLLATLQVQDEIRVLATLKHANIIRLLESTQDPGGGGWLLIMEYAKTGSLLDYCSALVRTWLASWLW